MLVARICICPDCDEERVLMRPKHLRDRVLVKVCRRCAALAAHRLKTLSFTYEAIHGRMRRDRGRASEYWCDSCDARAYDWAYLRDVEDLQRIVDEKGRAYSRDYFEMYVPMCRPCHRQADLKTHCKHGHPLTLENTVLGRQGERRCLTCLGVRNLSRRLSRQARRQSC